MISDQERFDAKWEIQGSCHIWTASLDRHGYGRFRFQGETRFAHRVAWFLLFNEWPEPGLDLDHLCRTPACVNVAHLEPVSRSVNLERGDMSRRADPAKCAAGLHDWIPENIYPNGRCIQCKRAYNSARYYRASRRKEL